jgi:hypothetical protein
MQLRAFALVIAGSLVASVSVAQVQHKPGPGVVGPLVPPPVMTNRPNVAPANGAPAKKGSAEAIVTPKRVSFGYLRTHDAQITAAILAQVQSGKLPKEAIGSFAPKPARQDLLNGRWSTVPKPKKPMKGQGSGGGVLKQGSLDVAIAGLSDWQVASTHGIGAPKPAPASPAVIDIGDVADKRVGAAVTWLTAPADGKYTVSLPAGTAFRIRDLTSYDGELIPLPGKPAGVVQHKEWETRTAAPFDLSIRAGQDFRVTVEFAPVFNLRTMPAGRYETMLEVHGPGWVTKVPVKARFLGPVLGVAINADVPDLALVTYYPAKDVPVPTRVQVVNFGPARSATLSGDGLPAGVALEGGSIPLTLKANETRWVDVRFLFTKPGAYEGFDYGYGQRLGLKLDYGSDTSRTSMNVDILEPWTCWPYEFHWDDLDMYPTYCIYADGHFVFSYMVYDTAALHHANGAFRFSLDGTEFGNIGWDVARDSSDANHYGFVRPQFHDEYVRWTKATARMHWNAEEYVVSP